MSSSRIASNATCPKACARSRSFSTRSATSPPAEAAGYLTFGNTLVGIFNWGTCLMYPEGFSCDRHPGEPELAASSELEVRDGAQERGN